MFPPKQNLWFEKMYPASLYRSWKEFSKVLKHLPSSVMKPDSRKEQTFVSTRLMLPPIVNSEFITWLKRKKAKIEGIQSFIRDWLVRNEKTAEMLYQGFHVRRISDNKSAEQNEKQRAPEKKLQHQLSSAKGQTRWLKRPNEINRRRKQPLIRWKFLFTLYNAIILLW